MVLQRSQAARVRGVIAWCDARMRVRRLLSLRVGDGHGDDSPTAATGSWPHPSPGRRSVDALGAHPGRAG